MTNNKKLRSLLNIILLIVVVVVYAYGLQVTDVDLKKPQEKKRQDQLTNILQGLAKPDILSYDIERLEIEASILIPCTENSPPFPNSQPNQATITLSNPCAEEGETITISGTGFNGNESIFIYFIPYVEDKADEVELKLANSAINSNSDGTFSTEVKLKRDRPSEHPQTIRAVVNRRIGSARPSTALIETFDKIIETVFLALIATTLGVFIAVPISFLAARNLMLQVSSSFIKFMATLIAIPLGTYGGYLSLNYLTHIGQTLINPNTVVWYLTTITLLGLATVKTPALNHKQPPWLIILKQITIFIIATVIIGIGGAALGEILHSTGTSLKNNWQSLPFFGNFLIIFADAIILGLPVLGSLIGLIMASTIAANLIEGWVNSAPATVVKATSIILAIIAGAILFGLIAAILNWFYEFAPLNQVIKQPALIGSILMGLLAVLISPTKDIPTGMFTYYIFRTIMNIFRSIEPLVMVVAFAVWVGIGPFAGVMALGLHTIVALGKLYSEQVENIAEGPIEAITATGANRLQTIIYAVIPQIVPPYIAFTLYRWDINVRMSTIIGFGGGGGIGFLLSQNINLLKYRQASVNMIAIAIVVMTLDYVSAKVREKIT